MLVLASSSPRRQELLRNAGISFVVQPADIDEQLYSGESPREYCERLAREKALKVFQQRSYEEIAEITGSSIPKLKTDLHRARAEMRRRIQPYLGVGYEV